MKKICTRFEVSIMRVYLIAFLHTALCSLTVKYEFYGGLHLLHLLYLQTTITQLSRILVTMYNNTYRPRDDPCRAPETAVYWGGITWLLLLTVTDCSATIHSVQTYSISGRILSVLCESFKIGSSNLSYTMKPCACAPIAFLVGIISWSVDSSHTKKTKEAKETMYVL